MSKAFERYKGIVEDIEECVKQMEGYNKHIPLTLDMYKAFYEDTKDILKEKER